MLVRSLQPPPTRLDELMDAQTIATLDRLDVVSRRVFAGKMPGERRSKSRGQSVEFDDFRQYTPGDDPRHIDWHVLARLDRLVVKLFRAEEDLGVRVVLDASPSMLAGDPPKALLAARLAIAIGYIGLVNQNRVSAFSWGTPGGGLHALRPVRGRRQLQRFNAFVLDALKRQHDAPTAGSTAGAVETPSSASPRSDAQRVEKAPPSPRHPSEPLDLNAALKRVAMDRAGGPGLVVVISDFLDRAGYKEGLNALAARGQFDVVCAQILAPGELDPARDADAGLLGDLRLIDAESGRGAEVTVTSGLLKRYRDRLDAFVTGLSAACAARGFTHLLTPSDADVGELVGMGLRERGVLG
ncbi:MAG: DUF58 domain-containing protein [Phycisphaerales bacterium]